MALSALIVGSTLGLIIGIKSFFAFDFSFLLAFLAYQGVGIGFTLLIIVLNLSDNAAQSEPKRAKSVART